MKPTWRWFGPADDILLNEVRQVGARGIVTALHHIKPGDVWPVSEIAQRKQMIEQAGLQWDVIESLPVSEDIKRQTSEMPAHIEAYKQSLKNIAKCGIDTVCYNFMPVLDWTRTNLRYPCESGALAMQFDLVEFAVFDMFLLGRKNAEGDYREDIRMAAEKVHADLDENGQDALIKNILAGLPGAQETWSLKSVSDQLESYQGIDSTQLRSNLFDFLSEVVPVAEELGIKLCAHPDDPPFPVLGLPRILSTFEDYRQMVEAVDSPSNGITFCTGSLGVLPEFDPTHFVEQLGSKIVFVHLRNTNRRGPSGDDKYSFFEAEHLGGNTDISKSVLALLSEERKRFDAGRADWSIPFRPDHGQSILGDHHRKTAPGYPLFGRMKGLAELNGLIAAHQTWM